MLGRKDTCYLERAVETPDAGGSLTDAWSTIKKFKAFLRSMRGKELTMWSREVANVSYKLIADRIDDATIADRIRIKGKRYDITHVDNTVHSITKFYLEQRT